MVEKERAESRSEGIGISGFTIGVIGIIFSGWIGIILSAVGLSFCLVQQKKHKTRMAKVGLIINAIGIILSVLIIALYSKLAPLLNQAALA
jgi:hypothetical protein